MNLRGKKGVTLLEVLVAALVFTVALGALLSSMLYILYLIDISKNQTAAVSDLRSIMERVRSTPFSNVIALFPNGTADGPAANRYATILGGYTLNNEHITVTYPNINADPLEIRAGITWSDRNNRQHTTSLSTFKTR